MNSWHLARTGKLPLPSPLQQRAIDRREQAQFFQQQQNFSHTIPATAIDSRLQTAATHESMGVPTSSGLPSANSPFPAGVLSAEEFESEWRNVPYSLTRLLQQLWSHNADLTRNLNTLKSAHEELRRDQKHLVTHETLKSMTSGTVGVQRDLLHFKSEEADKRRESERKMSELSNRLGKLEANVDSLSRKLAAHESSTGTQLELLGGNFTVLQSDLKERGLIMARLGDKIMDHVDGMQTNALVLEDKLKQLERRMHNWEFTTAQSPYNQSKNTQNAMVILAPNTNQAVSAPATAQGSRTVVLSPSTGGASNPNLQNPFSSAGSLNARKAGHFVTHEAIQAVPPGSAVFLSAAKDAQREANLHPLSGVISEHAAERAAETSLEAQIRTQAQEEQRRALQQQQQAQLQQVADTFSGNSMPPVITPISPRSLLAGPLSPRGTGLSAEATKSVSMTLPAAAPPTTAPQSGPPGSQESTQFNRYMADYTTRNLQRDLLEIAETYQSTIRNEIDGLRAQLLTVRRNHSEQMAKHTASLENFTHLQSGQSSEMKRQISVLEMFLRAKTSEVMERLVLVEKKLGHVDGLSATRSAQLELKYSARNEEILAWVNSIQAQLDEGFRGKVLTTQEKRHANRDRPGGPHAAAAAAPTAVTERPGSSSGVPGHPLPALEREMLLLQSSFSGLVRHTSERHGALHAEVTAMKERVEKNTRKLESGLASLSAQMKSLFADAFASLSLDILPRLTPSSAGAHGDSVLGNIGEKKMFQLRPKTVEQQKRSGSRTGTKNVTQFFTNEAYRMDPNALDAGANQQQYEEERGDNSRDDTPSPTRSAAEQRDAERDEGATGDRQGKEEQEEKTTHRLRSRQQPQPQPPTGAATAPSPRMGRRGSKGGSSAGESLNSGSNAAASFPVPSPRSRTHVQMEPVLRVEKNELQQRPATRERERSPQSRSGTRPKAATVVETESKQSSVAETNSS